MGDIYLDKKTGLFLPDTARPQAKGYSEAGASLTRRALKAFTPRSGSPREDIDWNNLTLRQRGRMLYMSSPVATSAINTNRTKVVGVGLTLKSSVAREVLGISPEAAKYVVSGISGTKTFNLAGLQASAVVFPNAHMKRVFDQFWMNMDIHRNNAFSLTAMQAAFNEGAEWLDQLLPYLSGNFDFVVNYCKEHIPRIKTYAPDATYLMWLDCRELGLSNEELRRFMIEKAKLGFNEGWTFGRSLSGYMRLNAACPRSVLEQAMKQLEAAVEAL